MSIFSSLRIHNYQLLIYEFIPKNFFTSNYTSPYYYTPIAVVGKVT